MRTDEYLVLIRKNGVFEDKTKDIKFCKYNSTFGKYEIQFVNSFKTYSYGNDNILLFKDPKIIPGTVVKLSIGDKDLYNIKAVYIFNDYYHILFENGWEETYNKNELCVELSCIDENNESVFEYLEQIANLISVKGDNEEKILKIQYMKMREFLGKSTAAAKYLSSKPIEKHKDKKIVIFPFGTNASQTKAVHNALDNQISVIEGPPGTGKTQTILNIIANLVLRGKTVQVVSNNNSAIENVYEKLCKHGYGFLVAPLGKKSNKNRFIKLQNGIYPDMTEWEISDDDIKELNIEVKRLSTWLKIIFSLQITMAECKKELQFIQSEKFYFDRYCRETNIPDFSAKKLIKLNSLLDLWLSLEKSYEKGLNTGLLNRIKILFLYGLNNRKMLKLPVQKLISILKRNYYIMKSIELEQTLTGLKSELELIEDHSVIAEYVSNSQVLFRYMLYKRFGGMNKRRVFKMEDLWGCSEVFVQEYPIVLSTTYSSRSCLRKSYVYDYIIMDEASQVDVSTGLLALSSARNAVIVGDTKQLPNIITRIDRKIADGIFAQFNIPDSYNFSKHSFLSSVCSTIESVPNTLLREHYRCHPKIIEFCNRKFYDGKLIIMTEDAGETDVLKVYETVEGNHKRNHINQRQIDVISEEILPKLRVGDYLSLGIIEPYKDQVEALKKAIDSDIKIATVHKFQGQEKDSIILSTVDDEITSFSDDPNLLNVAVSRAIKRFEIVVNSGVNNTDTNIGELLRYIKYNNFEAVMSETYSVFDCLYSQYAERREELIKKSKKVSRYDSENLMKLLIDDVLSMNEYAGLGVVCHLSLSNIFRVTERLSDEEKLFVSRPGSHVDFMIYKRTDKMPVLAVEVDGYDYHKKGSKQYQRDRLKDGIFKKYQLPLIRFSTNGSNEKGRILKELSRIIHQ